MSASNPTPALAVDAGQTGIKVRSVGTDEYVQTFPGVQTSRDLLPQLSGAVTRATEESGITFHTVAYGTSGLTEQNNDPVKLRQLLEGSGVDRVILAHDSISSYLGALGQRHGVVVAAGTGVVTLGVGPRGMSRVDGWGFIMGDAGSGFWMGRAVLEAVMRAYDHRGPATALTDVVTARFPHLDQAYIQLQTDPDMVRVVASFARYASDQAATDEVAASICRRAGEELALSAATAARNVGLVETGRSTICFVGNIYRSVPVHDACSDALARLVPDHEVVAPQGDGLDGATALLTLPADHPLTPHVAVSGGVPMA